MRDPTRHAARTAVLLTAVVAMVAASACADGPTQTLRPPRPSLDAVKPWEAVASTRWNVRATELLALRPPAANGPAAAVRVLTYVSLAQYRAALAADEAQRGAQGPSVAAAVSGASVAVLTAFFPLDVAALDVAALEAQLDADLAAPTWPGAKHEDAAAGEALGRAVGAAVLALAGTDDYLTLSPGLPPVGPGYWTSSPAPIVRGLHGVRPFFLTSADQLRPSAPPAFGSPAFLAALAEVRAISDTRTPEQLAIAVLWNMAVSPFAAGAWNRTADDLLREHRRGELEAARVLAYANAAAFDATIACFDAKFAYWFIRPSQADPAIGLPIGLPNHPSYPSGHSCILSAIAAVLAHAFPDERRRLDGMAAEAGLSRVYGGIHYGFDIAAGQQIGRQAAALALAGSLR